MLTDLLYYIFLGFYAYSIYVALRLVFGDNRNPVSTLGWMVVLLFIPILGLAVYTVFGHNMRRSRRILKLSVRGDKSLEFSSDDRLLVEAAANNIHNTGYSVTANVIGLIRLLYGNGKSLLYTSSDIKVLSDPKMTFDSIFADIQSAKDHIHIEFYIISDDAVGNRLRELLIRKAKEGVRVRVIYDYWGSTVTKKYCKSLKDAGVKLHAFFPPKFPFILRHVNYRNHRKIVVVDGKVAYTGGVNIADRYLLGNDLGLWRDTMVRMEGPVVHAMQETFLGDWYFIDHMRHRKPKYFPDPSLFNDASSFIQIVDSGPDTQYKSILQAVNFLVTTAQKYVYIQTPYFMPPAELENAIITTALRGVDIRLLIPEESDASMAQAGNASYIEEMLEAGVKVYWYKGGFLHSKAIVVDDYISSVGTSNMDFRSYEQNFEVNAFIYDYETATMIRDNFLNDLKSSEMAKLELWRKRSRLQRFKESFSRLFSPAM